MVIYHFSAISRDTAEVLNLQRATGLEARIRETRTHPVLAGAVDMLSFKIFLTVDMLISPGKRRSRPAPQPGARPRLHWLN